MTTHRRAWSARAGVVVALTAGALVTLPAAPALAEAPTVTIVNLPSATVPSGAETTVAFSVQNNNENASSFSIEVEGFDGLSCTEGCDPTQAIAPGATQDFTAKLKADQVAAGQQKAGQLTISADGPNNDDGEASVQMTVKGAAAPPPQVPTVKEVSGRVIDERTGDPVDNAFVLLKDAKSKTFDTYTNESGTYRFTGSADNPIAPGALQIGAQKDDVQDTRQINASANQRLTNVRLTLKITVAPTASPTPDAALPTGELTPDGAIPTEQVATPGEQVAASDSESGGMGSWLVVLGGGLLVALGVGGIVWVLVRRRESGDDEDDVGATGVRPAVPVGGAGMGAAAGGYGDSTRMVPRAARDPLADAPTMLHSRAPVDEFPDPYGAPMPAQPPGYGAGYGQPTQQYGGQPPAPYGGYDAPSSGGGYAAPGAPTYGGAPAGAPTYGGAPAGGPPQAYDDRYDEPTGRYQPANGSGYGPQSGYEQPPADYRGGYDQQGGAGYGAYPDQGYDQGGYDQPQVPRGYNGGYDQGGYEQQQQPGGGYDRVPPQQRGGYDQYGANGYEQQPGGAAPYYPEDEQQQQGGRARHGAPQGRGDRRQLDWLDD